VALVALAATLVGLVASPYLSALAAQLPPLRLLPFALWRRGSHAVRLVLSGGALTWRAELRLWRTMASDNAVASAALVAARVATPVVAACLALPTLLLMRPAGVGTPRAQPSRRGGAGARGQHRPTTTGAAGLFAAALRPLIFFIYGPSSYRTGPPASAWALLAPFALACFGPGPGFPLLIPALWMAMRKATAATTTTTTTTTTTQQQHQPRGPALWLLRASDSRVVPLAALALLGVLWSAAEAATGATWAQARALLSFEGPQRSSWWLWLAPHAGVAAGSTPSAGSGSVYLRWAAFDGLLGALVVLPWLAYCDARARLARPPSSASGARLARRMPPTASGGGGAPAAAAAAGVAATVRLLSEMGPPAAIAALCAALPVVGPAIYALVRPQVVVTSSSSGAGGENVGAWLGQRTVLPRLRSTAAWALERASALLPRGGGGGSRRLRHGSRDDLSEEEKGEAGGYEDEGSSEELTDEEEEEERRGAGAAPLEEEEEGEGEGGAAGEEEEEEPEGGPVVAGHVLRRRRGPGARA
jgi:hypothetical protein